MITKNLTLSKVDKGFNAQRSTVFSSSSQASGDDNFTESKVIIGVGETYPINNKKFILIASDKPVSIEGTQASFLIIEGKENNIIITGLYSDTTIDIVYNIT